MNKHGLVTRLAFLITVAAAVVGFLSTQIFHRITYHHELAISKQEIEQLHTTISATTSIASYLEDEELLNEAVNGLVSNNVVESVSITTTNLSIKSNKFTPSQDAVTFQLFSPFEADREVGTLIITPNINYIQNRAAQISTDNSIAIAVQAAIVTLVLIVVAITVITNPIIKIAKQLHNITPGTPARLDYPNRHDNSELGELVTDINYVLTKAEVHIIEERNLRSEIERLSKHFQMLFENSTSPIVLMEPKGKLLLYNSAFSKLLQHLKLPMQDSFGPYLTQLFEETEALNILVKIAFDSNETASGEFKLINSKLDKPDIWVQAIISTNISEDNNEYHQVTLHDISKRKLQLEDLGFKANTDQLTQLLNRRGTEQTLNKFIANHTPFALILLDLNKFKPINDIYGHDAGDEILIHVAQQLIKALRRRDLLSRWGGDEFIIILPNLKQKEVLDVVEKIHGAIATPYQLAQVNKSVAVGASMGCAFYPQDEQSLAGLISVADKAMYHAKARHESDEHGYFCLYSDYLQQTSASDNTK
ncbi:diguanylate cyclase domain-containing protein [Thalassotalea sp. PLHSN55]|uniref:sensor domain-containing diguanylate cyclase n=1 Tax=Thalassotalea sp. PLHSN55 TaxID=3435888 RepID=UPI003F838B36